MRCCALGLFAAAVFIVQAVHAQSGVFDVVIAGGRVI